MKGAFLILALSSAVHGLLSSSSGLRSGDAASFSTTLARVHIRSRATVRMDEKSRAEAEAALERLQQRSSEYNRDSQKKGPLINPATYNVAYSLIILVTL